MLQSGQLFAYVSRVRRGERGALPIFPGYAKKLHWAFSQILQLYRQRGEKMRQAPRFGTRFGRKSRNGAKKSALRRRSRRRVRRFNAQEKSWRLPSRLGKRQVS